MAITVFVAASDDERVFHAAPPCRPAVQADSCRADLAVTVVSQDTSDGISLYLSGSTPEIGWVDVSVPQSARAAFLAAAQPGELVYAQIWRDHTYEVRAGDLTEPTDDLFRGDSGVLLMLAAALSAWLALRSASYARLRRVMGSKDVAPRERRTLRLADLATFALTVVGCVVLGVSTVGGATAIAAAQAGLAYRVVIPYMHPLVTLRLAKYQPQDSLLAEMRAAHPANRRFRRFMCMLYNHYEPPHLPIIRTMIAAGALVWVVFGVIGMGVEEQDRAAFEHAPACPVGVIQDGCRGTLTATVTDTHVDHNDKGAVDGYELSLSGPAPASGWVAFGPADSQFKAAAAPGKRVSAEIWRDSVVAVMAGGVNRHSDNWPSTVVWSSTGNVFLPGIYAWLLLRSAGRAMWWRALGGRQAGWPTTTMRIIDGVTFVVYLVGGLVLVASITAGVAVTAVAYGILLLSIVLPRCCEPPPERSAWPTSSPKPHCPSPDSAASVLRAAPG